MTLARLVFREISHRKANFALMVTAVAVAAITVIGADWVTRRNAELTQRLMEKKQAETEQAIQLRIDDVAAAGKALEDTIRKQMLGLGFNVLILPADQDVSELHLQGSLSATMPEAYAEKLAGSNIMTINHLLPTVMKQVRWPEQDIDIVLYGTRGEVPLMHRDLKKPLLDAVAPGQIVVGHSIHSKLDLKVGQEIELMGKPFTVSRLHPERGSTDDVTVWIDLGQAQRMLGMENLVHAILALECECAGDRIAAIRAEIGEILPGTQVIERYSQALARAEARSHAKEVAEQALESERAASGALLARERAARQQIELRHRKTATMVLPLVLLAAAAMVGTLAYVNVRNRREELGILRALGLRTGQVLAVFMTKSLLCGFAGGIAGTLLGLAAGYFMGPWIDPADQAVAEGLASSIFFLPGFLFTLIITPLLAVALSVASSWVAAVWAAQQDAALILQGE